MGNLLGAPVTEKETHVGATEDGIQFGVSSMQGWRVHMEDAHIAETRLYATEVTPSEDGSSQCKRIDLPGHSLFAVFDGHGGTFAAIYAGKNLCRVLSRQPKFVQYAKFIQERAEKEKQLTNSADRVQYITAGLELVEGALCDAFIEIDKEIASALQGTRHPDADKPYQVDDESKPQEHSSAENGDAEAMQGVSSTTTVEQEAQSAADSALQLLEKEGDSGTTACVVLVAPQWVVCANAGDSRAVFSKLGNKPVPLSYDHKPDDEEEERRIRAAGGYVAGGRVEGDLAVSRGLGDFRFKDMNIVLAGGPTGEMNNNSAIGAATNIATEKDDATNQQSESILNNTVMKNNNKQSQLVAQAANQKVSPVPDVIIQNRSTDKDEFIIVACDGIWDVQSNYEAVKTVAELFKEGESNMGLVSEEMCDICLSMGSKDNMTAIVIKFDGQKIGQGGGVMRRRQIRDSETENSGNRMVEISQVPKQT